MLLKTVTKKEMLEDKNRIKLAISAAKKVKDDEILSEEKPKDSEILGENQNLNTQRSLFCEG